MKAIIPAAGYATRLYPITKNQPKALIEVKGKPIIEHIIKRIAEVKEVDHIFIVTNNKFFFVFEQWLDSFNCHIPIKIINDHTTSNDDRKGQVGDIIYAIDEEQLDDDLLIIAGDNLFNFSLKPCHDFFIEKKSNVNALYDVRDKEEAKNLGIVSVDTAGKFLSFEEKPKNPKSTLASLGIMFFSRETIETIRAYVKEGNDPDMMGNFFTWFITKQPVYGHIYKKKWFDIGSFEALGKAREEFSEFS